MFSFKMKWRGAAKIAPVIATVAALSGADWASAATEADPWEDINRSIFNFNDSLDSYLLKPVAQGYKDYTPEMVQTGVTNFFKNIGDVGNLVNDLFQAKFEHAGVDTSRLIFNTTFGVVGLVDVADYMGLKRNDEDFGQTLGYWGVESGPYLVLPFFGPSNIRDGLGSIPDNFMTPTPYIQNGGAQFGLFASQAIDKRAQFLSAEKVITGDRYVFVRNAYLQNREFLIKDGQVVDDF